MKSKKLLILCGNICLTLILAALLLVSGCAETTPAPAPAPAPTPAPAPAPAPAPKPIEIKCSYPSPPAGWWYDNFIAAYTEEIGVRSGGRLKVIMFPGGELASFPEAYAVAASGVADMSFFTSDPIPGRFPLSGIISVPFVLPNSVIAGQIVKELFNSKLNELEFTDTRMLLTYIAPPHFLQTVPSKPVQKLEDIKGLKIRTLGGTSTTTIEALGAAPIPISPAETYTSVERNVVDGVIFAYYAGDIFKLHELKLNVTEVPLYTSLWASTMNLDTWNSLPADLQDIIIDVSAEWEFRSAVLYQEYEEMSKDIYLSAGCKLYQLSSDELARWQAAVEPSIKVYLDDLTAKGLPAYEVWGEFVRICEKYHIDVGYEL